VAKAKVLSVKFGRANIFSLEDLFYGTCETENYERLLNVLSCSVTITREFLIAHDIDSAKP
jgi:hypothetical protein